MHPDNFRTIRHGTAVGEIAEEHSVPEGKAKSEQALVRRPPYARRATAPERARRLFSYTGRGAFSFWRNQKENGGRIAQLAPQLNPPGG